MSRLRDTIAILRKIRPRFGSLAEAFAWYEQSPLPGYGGLTAEALVREGRGAEVTEYVDAVDAGVYA